MCRGVAHWHWHADTAMLPARAASALIVQPLARERVSHVQPGEHLFFFRAASSAALREEGLTQNAHQQVN